MKRNIYLSSSPSFLHRRWRLILLAVALVLVLPKVFSVISTTAPGVQAPALALFKLIPLGTGRPAASVADRPEVSAHESEADQTAAEDALEEPGLIERIISVGRGDTLMGLLLQAGLAQAEAHAVVTALKEVYNPRNLRPGHELILTFRSNGEEGCEEFEGLKMQVDVDRNVLVQRAEDETFAAMEEQWELKLDTATAEGRIESSLYEAALQAGLPVPVLMQMIRAYSFDIDFQRDIHPGDSFEVLFERQVDLEGRPVREGPVLYANLEIRGRTLRIYRFTPLDGETDFFNERGQSVRKTLMLTPIDGARLSSGFGMRRHPILGYSRMHRGLDFAAPTGTPIMAAGDGVVVEAGRKGNYGNTVVLRHPNEIRTLYAHMSRFARGIKVGARVKQGDVIGYVGSTGMSTGPHLHYEVLVRGKHVNPASVVSPPGRTLTGQDLECFRAAVSELEERFAVLAGRQLARFSDDE